MQAVFTLSGNCRELGWQPICRFKSSSCSSLAAPRCWDGIGAGMASGGLGRSSARAEQLARWLRGLPHEALLPWLPMLPSSAGGCAPRSLLPSSNFQLTSSQSRRPAAGQHGAEQRRMRRCRQPAGPLPGWAAASAAGRGGLSTRHYLPVPSCTSSTQLGRGGLSRHCLRVPHSTAPSLAPR